MIDRQKDGPRQEESAILAAARAQYHRELKQIEGLLRESPHFAKSDQVRVQAEYYLEQVKAVAFNLGIAPRQHYPRFLVDTLFGPNLYPIWGPNPDFKYAWTWLDGRKTYRIWGNRHDTLWGSFQVSSEFWGDPNERSLGDFPFDNLAIEADGSYEIIASATQHPGNWIPLDPDTENNFIFLRRSMGDWERETVATAFIEMLSDPEQPIFPDEEQLAQRIARAGTILKNATIKYTLGDISNAIDHAGFNAFHCVSGNLNQNAGYNPGAYYFRGVFDIMPEEALIIETQLTKARYWGMHATDIWLQSLDYVNHQSSLNAVQTRVDKDGIVRFVLALQDPGVPNWLDPLGCGYGMLQFRSYYGDAPPRLDCRRVPLSRLWEFLPPETPAVAKEERAALMRRRARSLLRHYGT